MRRFIITLFLSRRKCYCGNSNTRWTFGLVVVGCFVGILLLLLLLLSVVVEDSPSYYLLILFDILFHYCGLTIVKQTG